MTAFLSSNISRIESYRRCTNPPFLLSLCLAFCERESLHCLMYHEEDYARNKLCKLRHRPHVNKTICISMEWNTHLHQFAFRRWMYTLHLWVHEKIHDLYYHDFVVQKDYTFCKKRCTLLLNIYRRKKLFLLKNFL